MNRWKSILLVASLPTALAFAQATTPPRPPDAARAGRGKAVYERYCLSCHGEHGDGRGYSAQWLDPRPRDFTRAIFKCRSTPSGTLPEEGAAGLELASLLQLPRSDGQGRRTLGFHPVRRLGLPHHALRLHLQPA